MHLQGKVYKQVNDLLTRGLIRPSDSPWSSPIVLAPKKNGTYRFCVDFRRVNAVTRKDAHPMPRVDDILDQLGGGLASGYWQVPLREEDKAKTAFAVGLVHYEFNVMPFDLTNAPATFQRMMCRILQGCEGCFVFIDDIIVFGRTFEEHFQRQEAVFARIREAGLKIRSDKCHFASPSVKFLSRIVSSAGIRPDPGKVRAIKDYSTPSSVTEVRAFVGMASYYRRYIQGFADSFCTK